MWDPDRPTPGALMATITATDGYYEREFRTWRAFQRFVEESLPRSREYIWRGQQRSDWALTPTLDRLQAALTTSVPVERTRVLEAFRRAVVGRRGANPRDLPETELWALGQHFGLATPLLDWTRSPYTAAYFAFEHDAAEGRKRRRAVFGLFPPVIENAHDRAYEALGDKADMLEILTPLVDENARLVSQGGSFTRTVHGRSIEDWVRKVFVGETHPLLVKLLLPDAVRPEVLRSLNRMNINALTLFPDLEGAARYVNMSQRITDY